MVAAPVVAAGADVPADAPEGTGLSEAALARVLALVEGAVEGNGSTGRMVIVRPGSDRAGTSTLADGSLDRPPSAPETDGPEAPSTCQRITPTVITTAPVAPRTAIIGPRREGTCEGRVCPHPSV